MANEYSLSVVVEKIYENQLGLEAALMELVLLVEQQGFKAVGENAGFVKQGLARLRNLEKD